jgi:tetratricopeptide (TPR) repeat protein
MKRYLLIAGVLAGLSLIVLGAVVASWSSSVSSDDGNRVAAGNHAEKGAAYLKRHLYGAAIREFEAAARRSPRALDPWLGLAAAYIRLGDGQRALEGAAKAVDIARDSAGVQLVFGRANWLVRNFDDAERAGLKARELEHSNLQAAELLLNVYAERREESKFEDLIERIQQPSRPIQDIAIKYAIRRSQFQRAYDLQTRYQRRRLEGEVFRAQLALKRSPDQHEIYPGLIRNLVTLGRAKDAIAAGRQYSGRIPVDLELGKAHWLVGNRNEAILAFGRASAGNHHKLAAEAALFAITGDLSHWREAFRAELLEKDYFVLALMEDVLPKAGPLEKTFIYRYAGVFETELFSESAKQALEVLNSDPGQFDALMSLGTAYLRLGRVDDAIRYVTQGREEFPDRAEVWARLGQLALAKGDIAGAQPHLEKAVQLTPGNASYLYNYGWLLDQLDRDKEAIPYYERAIAASSLSFEAMNNLALIESAAARPDRALALLDRATASNPENDAAFMNRGAYHAGQRAWSEALADYARASELNPANGYARVEAARTHLELDRVSLAIEDLNQALDTDPHLAEAYLLLASAYKKEGRDDEAAAALEEAKRIEGPKNLEPVGPAK